MSSVFQTAQELALRPFVVVPEFSMFACTMCCADHKTHTDYHLLAVDELKKHLSRPIHSVMTSDEVEAVVGAADRCPGVREMGVDANNFEVPPALHGMRQNPLLGRVFERGGRCTQCGYICHTTGGARKHFKARHHDEAPVATTRSQLVRYYQRIRDTIFVEVSSPFAADADDGADVDSDNTDGGAPSDQAGMDLAFYAIKSRLRLFDATEATYVTTYDERLGPNAWVARMEWASHFSGWDMDRVYGLASRKAEEGWFPDSPRVREDFPSVVSGLQAVWETVECLVLEAHRLTQSGAIGRIPLLAVQRYQPDAEVMRPAGTRLERATLIDYLLVWKRVLAYLCRVVVCGPPKGGRVPGFLLRPAQRQACDRLRDVFFARGAVSSVADREAAVLAASVSILDHPLVNQVYDSVCLSALAAQGVGEGREWLPAARFTKKMSGFLRLARLFVLLDAYRESGLDGDAGGGAPHRTREPVGEDDAEASRRFGLLVLERVGRFMGGTYTENPYRWVAQARAHGMAIAKAENENRGSSMVWHGDVLQYGDMRVPLDDFTRAVRNLVASLLQKAHQDLMMFPAGEEPPNIDLPSLRDSASSFYDGYHVASDPENASVIEPGKKFMINRIEQSGFASQWYRGGEWMLDTVRRWLAELDDFRELLLAAMHILGGQPARGTEVTGLLYRNIPGGIGRSILVIGGRVCYVTRYHKNFRATGQSKLIHRFLPHSIGQVLIQYLFRILPFARMAYQVAFAVGEKRDWVSCPNPYLFGTEVCVLREPKPVGSHEPGGREYSTWGTPRLSAALASVLGTAMSGRGPAGRSLGFNTRSYRQVAISIALRYLFVDSPTQREAMREAAGVVPGEPAVASLDDDEDDEGADGDDDDEGADDDDDDDDDDDENQAGPSRLARKLRATLRRQRTLQAGHGQSIEAAHYALGFFLGSHMSTQMEKFMAVSDEWHRLFWPSARRAVDGRMDSVIPVSPEQLGRRRRERLAGEDPLAHLRTLAGQSATFRGRQEEAVGLVLRSTPCVIHVAPTGGGKTMTFLVPVAAGVSGVTVVVAPFIALLHDLQRRCRRHGIVCAVWDGTTASSFIPARVVLVTPENFVRHGTRLLLSRLQAEGMLDRIVFDEVHCVLDSTPEFRETMASVPGDMVAAGVPMVFLTATLPPRDEGRLLEMIHPDVDGDPGIVQMIREPTRRTNIAYSIDEVGGEPGLVGRIQDEVLRIMEDRGSSRRVSSVKMIVYCPSVGLVDRLAAALGCPRYHAKLGDESDAPGGGRAVRLGVLESWTKLGGPIVATCGLGAGIDDPNIRLVIHAGPSRSLRDFVQESGRAGRDGRPARSLLLLHTSQQKTASLSDEEVGDPGRVPDSGEDMHWYQCRYGGCLRVTLDRVMDGVMDADTARCRAGEEACGECARRGGVPAPGTSSEGGPAEPSRRVSRAPAGAARRAAAPPLRAPVNVAVCAPSHGRSRTPAIARAVIGDTGASRSPSPSSSSEAEADPVPRGVSQVPTVYPGQARARMAARRVVPDTSDEDADDAASQSSESPPLDGDWLEVGGPDSLGEGVEPKTPGPPAPPAPGGRGAATVVLDSEDYFSSSDLDFGVVQAGGARARYTPCGSADGRRSAGSPGDGWRRRLKTSGGDTISPSTVFLQSTVSRHDASQGTILDSGRPTPASVLGRASHGPGVPWSSSPSVHAARASRVAVLETPGRCAHRGPVSPRPLGSVHRPPSTPGLTRPRSDVIPETPAQSGGSAWSCAGGGSSGRPRPSPSPSTQARANMDTAARLGASRRGTGAEAQNLQVAMFKSLRARLDRWNSLCLHCYALAAVCGLRPARSPGAAVFTLADVRHGHPSDVLMTSDGACLDFAGRVDQHLRRQAGRQGAPALDVRAVHLAVRAEAETLKRGYLGNQASYTACYGCTLPQSVCTKQFRRTSPGGSSFSRVPRDGPFDEHNYDGLVRTAMAWYELCRKGSHQAERFTPADADRVLQKAHRSIARAVPGKPVSADTGPARLMMIKARIGHPEDTNINLGLFVIHEVFGWINSDLGPPPAVSPPSDAPGVLGDRRSVSSSGVKRPSPQAWDAGGEAASDEGATRVQIPAGAARKRKKVSRARLSHVPREAVNPATGEMSWYVCRRIGTSKSVERVWLDDASMAIQDGRAPVGGSFGVPWPEVVDSQPAEEEEAVSPDWQF